MTRKSFKDNPAFQFMSQPEEEEEATTAPQEPVPALQVKPPEGYKLNPLYVEVKKRRLQLVLKPSLYEKVKSGASKQGLSVNEYVHRILEEATKAED